MRLLVFSLLVIASASLTAACNTMEGAGQDLQEGGRALEREAQENR